MSNIYILYIFRIYSINILHIIYIKMLSLHFLTHFAAGFSKCLKKELLNPLLVATCYRTYLRKTPLQSRAKPHARETESIPPLEIPSQTY